MFLGGALRLSGSASRASEQRIYSTDVEQHPKAGLHSLHLLFLFSAHGGVDSSRCYDRSYCFNDA